MMLRDTISEIRIHPGRFVATLMAISISVAFIAAISTLVGTEQQSMARFTTLGAARADVVVSGEFQDPAAVRAALGGVAGVTAVDSTSSEVSMLSNGGASVFVSFVGVPTEPFRWASLNAGVWPTGPNEVALSTDGLAQLNASVGDDITLEGIEQQVTVVGTTTDPKALFGVTGYVMARTEMGGDFILRTDGNPQSVVPAVREAVASASPGEEVAVQTGEDFRAEALNNLTRDFDLFRSLLFGFAGVALVVGIITISNTFTILVTQRRRQIGLLRAVGASTGQVRGRLVWEAILLGVVGSLIGIAVGVGVAAIGAAITGSIFWGLVIHPGELLVALGVGVAATMLSVVGPSFVATRVSPIEALQVVPSGARARRLSTFRAVVCGLLGLGGIVLVGVSRLQESYALLWAMGAGFLLSIAILGAAPFYIPALLRLLGLVFGFTGPTTRLAATNAARNPQRAAATAVALMLAVGLVVTLQVAVSTVRTSGQEAIDQRYPVDVTLASEGALPQDLLRQVNDVDGVSAAVAVTSKVVDVDGFPLTVRNVNPARGELGVSDKLAAGDGTLMVEQDSWITGPVELPGVDGPVAVAVSASAAVPFGKAAVSEATFEQLQGEPRVAEIWIQMTDRTSATTLNALVALSETSPEIQMDGSAFLSGILQQVLDVVLIVLTALLGVAVLIALVGVGNTLGLSVIERQRESALLRALGMQRAGLRTMLLIEALMLAIVGTGVGILAGGFFGWLGVSSAVLMMPAETRPDLVFSVDVGITVLLIAICFVAAGVASILPGRLAANATPTEALAVE